MMLAAGGAFSAPVVAVSTLELSIRMLVALGLVLGLMAGVNTVLRRRFGSQRGPRLPVAVRYQQRLDKQSSVHLIEAGDRHLLVGTSGQSIVLLAEGADLAPRSAGGTKKPRDKIESNEKLGSNAKIESNEKAADDKDGQSIDIRSAVNPIRLLQDRTLRRS